MLPNFYKLMSSTNEETIYKTALNVKNYRDTLIYQYVWTDLNINKHVL